MADRDEYLELTQFLRNLGQTDSEIEKSSSASVNTKSRRSTIRSWIRSATARSISPPSLKKRSAKTSDGRDDPLGTLPGIDGGVCRRLHAATSQGSARRESTAQRRRGRRRTGAVLAAGRAGGRRLHGHRYAPRRAGRRRLRSRHVRPPRRRNDRASTARSSRRSPTAPSARPNLDGTTPFAAVTFFAADGRLDGLSCATLDDLDSQLDRKLPHRNSPYALRIRGQFAALTIRSVPAQSPPFEPLVEVVKHQATWQHRNLRGTLVGLRCPAVDGNNQRLRLSLAFLERRPQNRRPPAGVRISKRDARVRRVHVGYHSHPAVGRI